MPSRPHPSTWHISSTPAAGVAASASKAAEPGRKHVLRTVVISADSATAAGLKTTIGLGTGSVVVYLPESAAQVIEFGDGHEAPENTAVSVVTDDPGAGAEGVAVFATGYTV